MLCSCWNRAWTEAQWSYNSNDTLLSLISRMRVPTKDPELNLGWLGRTPSPLHPMQHYWSRITARYQLSTLCSPSWPYDQIAEKIRPPCCQNDLDHACCLDNSFPIASWIDLESDVPEDIIQSIIFGSMLPLHPIEPSAGTICDSNGAGTPHILLRLCILSIHSLSGMCLLVLPTRRLLLPLRRMQEAC